MFWSLLQINKQWNHARVGRINGHIVCGILYKVLPTHVRKTSKKGAIL